ncbi:MAG: chorismate synthase [Bacteroidetes bacterium]|nr:chorismate synthase [Bacteroidota bacterium]
MAGNTFGKVFTLTSFGESHGAAIGGIIDGCPAAIKIDLDFIQSELDRRKPGQSRITTPRKEDDKVTFLSGIFEGKTTGTPIGFIIKNKDQQSKDYQHLKDLYRPSHADFTYDKKYKVRDYRGGGRASARETATRVVAGAIANLVLRDFNVDITAFVSQIGPISIENELNDLTLESIEKSMVRCPDEEASLKMLKYVEQLKEEGDSTGGIITCMIEDCPIGLGEPVFDKLQADLGKAMLSINAVKGFEFGYGFESTTMKGSELNDEFEIKNKKVVTKTNFSGGIQGGISNGSTIYFNVAFKPVATIKKQQNTVNKSGKEIDFKAIGRHDPCVVPRAVPIVESMAALVIVDHLLRNNLYQ